MARLCLACQTTIGNRQEHCPTCGRNVREAEQAWARGLPAWRGYLDATGWYPTRRDEWLESRLAIRATADGRRPDRPQRLNARYLGGHPALPRVSRVLLTRTAEAVVVSLPTWWLARPVRAVIPLTSIRSVSLQRTTESTPDDAVVTAAIGGARTGPLGLAFGAAVGRRRRVVRTVHVQVEVGREEAELLFRALDEQNASGPGVIMRIFQR